MGELIKNYREWAEKVQKELAEDRFWVSQYLGYAKSMLDEDNVKKYVEARKKFHVWHPLHAYLSIGEIDKRASVATFDLRYLGQSVGTLNTNKEGALLSVSAKQCESSRDYFGYNVGTFAGKKWNGGAEAEQFRAFFKGEKSPADTLKSGHPHSDEHMVESALFSELEKKSSANKTLKGIQPMTFAGVRIHMKTAVRASLSGKNETISLSRTGGEIDCLCRRNVSRGSSRLVVIEIKDENKKSESFDIAMKQAISYAVFLRELIRSEAGETWKKIWGMERQYRNIVAIDAVVCMPEGKTRPGYNGERIVFDNGDFIELHFIEITSKINPDNSENVEFRTSLS